MKRVGVWQFFMRAHITSHKITHFFLNLQPCAEKYVIKHATNIILRHEGYKSADL